MDYYSDRDLGDETIISRVDQFFELVAPYLPSPKISALDLLNFCSEPTPLLWFVRMPEGK